MKQTEKIAGSILRIAAGMVWLIIVIAIITALPIIGGFHPMTIMQEKMAPDYSAGDLTYYRQVDLSKLEDEDVVVYKNADGTPELKRIISKDAPGECLLVRADHDARESIEVVIYENIQGKAVGFKIPLAGYLLYIISKWYVIGGISIILFLRQLFAVKGNKGKVEEQYEDMTAADFFKDY